MKRLLSLTLAVMIAGAALAQDIEPNTMGLFFSDTIFTDDQTNLDTDGSMFSAYIVLLNTAVDVIGGYEVGIAFSDPGVAVVSAFVPNGWLNFGGSNTNHLVGYQVPLPPNVDGSAVLGTLMVSYAGADLVTIHFGPSDPSSFDGMGPGISDGDSPDLLYLCPTTTGTDVVATLNGEGVVPARQRTLSGVKSLFR